MNIDKDKLKQILNLAYNKAKKIGNVKNIKNLQKIDLNNDKYVQPQIKKNNILDKLKNIVDEVYFQQAEKINKSGKSTKFAGYIFKDKNGVIYIVNNLDKLAVKIKKDESLSVNSLDDFINLVKNYENNIDNVDSNNNVENDNNEIYEKFKNMEDKDVVKYIIENYQDDIQKFAKKHDIPYNELEIIQDFLEQNSGIKGTVDNKNNPRVISLIDDSSLFDDAMLKRLDLFFDKNLKLRAVTILNDLPDENNVDLKALHNLFNGEGLKQEGLFTDVVDGMSPASFIHSLLVGKYAIENNIDDISKINKDNYIEQLSEKYPYISDNNDKMLDKLKKDFDGVFILDKDFNRGLLYHNNMSYYMLFPNNIKGEGYQSFNVLNMKKYDLYKKLENNYSKFKMLTIIPQKQILAFLEPDINICKD